MQFAWHNIHNVIDSYIWGTNLRENIGETISWWTAPHEKVYIST